MSTEVTQRGDRDSRLAPIYTLSVLDFSLEDTEDTQEITRYVQLPALRKGEVFLEKLTFVYLEVQQFEREKELENDFV